MALFSRTIAAAALVAAALLPLDHARAQDATAVTGGVPPHRNAALPPPATPPGAGGHVVSRAGVPDSAERLERAGLEHAMVPRPAAGPERSASVGKAGEGAGTNGILPSPTGGGPDSAERLERAQALSPRPATRTGGEVAPLPSPESIPPAQSSAGR